MGEDPGNKCGRIAPRRWPLAALLAFMSWAPFSALTTPIGGGPE